MKGENLMATKNENRLVGKKMQKTHKEKIGPKGIEIQKENQKDRGDAEAGVDPQLDQLNDMPNDPTDRPLEKQKPERNS